MSARDGQMSELTPDILIRTYAAGIFPMAERADDPTLFWVDPDKRGVLPIDAFHITRKLQKKLRHNPFEIRCDTAYEAVIRACGAYRPERPKTWINSEIIRLYSGLFAMGHAHSVETWLGEGGNLGKQFKYANQRSIPYALVLGPDEVANGTVAVKNLVTGVQQVVPRAELGAAISEPGLPARA